MELPIKAVVVMVIAALFLTVVSSFFLFQAGSGVSKADAKRVFEQRCIEYGAKRCSWDVTEEQQFSQYVTACKVLYGQEREAFSCLYALCGQCQNVAMENIRCESVCKGIEGQVRLGNPVQEACSAYGSDSACRGVPCEVCPK